MTLVDNDRRAIEAAKRNIGNPRVGFHWTDVREPDPELSELDFVVMNAPFHDAGTEDRALALVFVKRAAEALRKNGVCWLTANRHLPYEAVMQAHFKRVDSKIETAGYKIFEAHK
jgi:16S rRNA (guanine1207-N2)-methyltransferase